MKKENDFSDLEEKLRKERKSKKKMKVVGASVRKLATIIKNKSVKK